MGVPPLYIVKKALILFNLLILIQFNNVSGVIWPVILSTSAKNILAPINLDILTAEIKFIEGIMMLSPFCKLMDFRAINIADVPLLQEIENTNCKAVVTTEKDIIKIPENFIRKFQFYIIKIEIIFAVNVSGTLLLMDNTVLNNSFISIP